MITTVVFDLGRVLVDIDFGAFPQALGLATAREQRPYRQEIISCASLVETGKISTPEFSTVLERVFKGKYDRRTLMAAWNGIIGPQNDAIVPVVHEVQKRCYTAVLSNTSEPHWEKAVLAAPILRTFADCFLSYQIGTAKPNLRIYQHVIRTLNRAARSIAFVDDLEENVVAAESVGMFGIVYTTPQQLRQDLSALGVTPSTERGFRVGNTPAVSETKGR